MSTTLAVWEERNAAWVRGYISSIVYRERWLPAMGKRLMLIRELVCSHKQRATVRTSTKVRYLKTLSVSYSGT